MLTYYLILGVSPDASDEEIRNSYIQLVKKHTPEKDPERFKQITQAYEAIKDKRVRIKRKIFGGFITRDYEETLIALAGTKESKRRRIGLKALFQLEKSQV